MKANFMKAQDGVSLAIRFVPETTEEQLLFTKTGWSEPIEFRFNGFSQNTPGMLTGLSYAYGELIKRENGYVKLRPLVVEYRDAVKASIEPLDNEVESRARHIMAGLKRDALLSAIMKVALDD